MHTVIINLSMIEISTSTEISNKNHIAWRIRKCVNSWKRYALPTFWTRIYIFSKRFQVFRDMISASYRKNTLILVIPPTFCFKGSEAFYTCETEVSRRQVCNIISDFTARCYFLKKVHNLKKKYRYNYARQKYESVQGDSMKLLLLTSSDLIRLYR